MDSYTANIEEVREVSVRGRALAFFELTKPRIAILLVLTSAAGFYLASNQGFQSLLFINAMEFGIANELDKYTRPIMFIFRLR